MEGHGSTTVHCQQTSGNQPKLPCPPNPLEANKLHSILNYGKNVYHSPYFIKKKGAQLVAKSSNYLHIIVSEIAYISVVRFAAHRYKESQKLSHIRSNDY
jgi:hypothetical protein